MISPDTLLEYGFCFIRGNKTVCYYGDWDYSYNTITHELHDINDGYGEPDFIAKIDNLDHLITVMREHCNVELKQE